MLYQHFALLIPRHSQVHSEETMRRIAFGLLLVCCFGMPVVTDAALRRTVKPIVTMASQATLQLARSIAARPDNTFISTWSRQSLIYFAIHGNDGTHGGAVGVGIGEIATVAVDAAGNFVIVWVGYEGDNSYGIYAQRYTAAGVATGPQVHVNEYTTNNQTLPAVAMNAGGEFVVVWQSSGQDGNLFEIYARRYDAFSIAEGGEFRVNETIANSQIHPSVAMRDDGSFIVTWANQTSGLTALGIKKRRYDGSGTALAGEEVIHTADASTAPVEVLPGGGFAVAYLQNTHAYLQRYTAAGVADGQPIHIYNGVKEVRLDVTADGRFAAAFDSEWMTQVSLFDANGVLLASGIDIADVEGGVTYFPWVALKPNGDVVVSWSRGAPVADFELRQVRMVRAVRLDRNGDLTGDILVTRDDSMAAWHMENMAIRMAQTWWKSTLRYIGPYYLGDTQTQEQIYQNPGSWALQTSHWHTIATPPAGWEARATADFDGDTRTDVVLHNQSTGEVAIWLLNENLTIRAGAIIGSAPAGWQIRAAGDVNADGKDDVILQHETSREVAIWRMDAFVITGAGVIASPAAGWSVRTSGDFNGDGRNDIALHNSQTGEIALWLMNDLTITGAGVIAQLPLWWRLGGATDANGDGRDDLVLEDTNEFQFAVWAMNGTTITQGRVIGVAPGWQLTMQAPN